MIGDRSLKKEPLLLVNIDGIESNSDHTLNRFLEFTASKVSKTYGLHGLCLVRMPDYFILEKEVLEGFLMNASNLQLLRFDSTWNTAEETRQAIADVTINVILRQKVPPITQLFLQETGFTRESGEQIIKALHRSRITTMVGLHIDLNPEWFAMVDQ